MKKATIKRRKRVIPASQEGDEDEVMESVETPNMESPPERGTVNLDGSINLGSRRYANGDLQPAGQLSAAEVMERDLAAASLSSLSAYRQPSSQIGTPDTYHAEERRLAPMASMAREVDRNSSISPASLMSTARKRSISTTGSEVDRHGGSPSDNLKRLSSITSILKSSDRMDTMGYSLPPLRAPAPTTGAYDNNPHSPHQPVSSDGRAMSQRQTSHKRDETARLKTDRRAALRREAEQMREMLAAKERELMELGE